MSLPRVLKITDRYETESICEEIVESDLYATVQQRLESGYELNIDRNATLDYHPIWKTMSRA
jgi:hypothetical protein